VLFLELAIGQFTGRGPIKTIGQLCPLLKGMNANYYNAIENAELKLLIQLINLILLFFTNLDIALWIYAN
jgi:Sodium:neurotransmitter symporter family